MFNLQSLLYQYVINNTITNVSGPFNEKLYLVLVFWYILKLVLPIKYLNFYLFRQLY